MVKDCTEKCKKAFKVEGAPLTTHAQNESETDESLSEGELASEQEVSSLNTKKKTRPGFRERKVGRLIFILKLIGSWFKPLSFI